MQFIPQISEEFANKIISLVLLILKEYTITGVIVKHSNLVLERNDKNYLQNWGKWDLICEI